LRVSPPFWSNLKWKPSVAVAKANDLASIALRRATGGELFPFARSFPLGGNFKAELTAGIGFTVERLSNGGGAADVAKGKDFNLEIAAVVGDAKHVTDADFAGRLGGLAVRLNAAEFAGARGKRAGLEEASGPEEFIEAVGHEDIVQYGRL
jgi:hypothetical protein